MRSPKHSSTRKIRVGILFGGKSAEHEISVQSALNVLQAIDTEKFEPVLIGIDRTGKWHYDTNQKIPTANALSSLASDTSDNTTVTLIPGDQKGRLITFGGFEHHTALDVIFPVLHGPMGEDGSVQGFLELANMPYVGPGVLGSAVGMDKDVMKRLLRDSGIPVTDFVVVKSDKLSDQEITKLVKRLGLPLFVKPANMGSSVGVSRVDNADKLLAAIREALQFDVKVLIERAIVGDEIECAVLGNDKPEASIIGRVIPKNTFYSYEAKYVDENGAILEIPAKIPSEAAKMARHVAIKTFVALGCEGMSRVDMFARNDGIIVVNEINTIPGFTQISMYPKLWEASGLSYTELISRLITLAIERFKHRQNLRTTYHSM